MKNVLFSVLEFEHIALIFESHHQKHILRAFNLQVVQGNQNTMRRYFHDLDMLTLLWLLVGGIQLFPETEFISFNGLKVCNNEIFADKSYGTVNFRVSIKVQIMSVDLAGLYRGFLLNSEPILVLGKFELIQIKLVDSTGINVNQFNLIRIFLFLVLLLGFMSQIQVSFTTESHQLQIIETPYFHWIRLARR